MIKVHQHALINQMLYQKKNVLLPNDVLVRPTEKVSRTSATSGKNESRALIGMCLQRLSCRWCGCMYRHECVFERFGFVCASVYWGCLVVR